MVFKNLTEGPDVRRCGKDATWDACTPFSVPGLSSGFTPDSIFSPNPMLGSAHE